MDPKYFWIGLAIYLGGVYLVTFLTAWYNESSSEELGDLRIGLILAWPFFLAFLPLILLGEVFSWLGRKAGGG